VQFQEDGMVAGLKGLSEKLYAQGAEGETHEPAENLVPTSSLAVGDKVFLAGDGPEFFGTIFEFQDDGMVAGIQDLSDKLKGLGCGYAALRQREAAGAG
jgi:hypothetical protein